MAQEKTATENAREYFDNMQGFAEGVALRSLTKKLANLSVSAMNVSENIGQTCEGSAYHRERVADFAKNLSETAQKLFDMLVQSSQTTSNETYSTMIGGYKLSDEDIAGFCIDAWVKD